MHKLGLEGVVGKRTDSAYEPDKRSGAWIKLRANLEQEFVIGGYIPGARGFDALLVGVYETKELNFVREGEERPCATDSRRALSGSHRTAKCSMSFPKIFLRREPHGGANR
jgi:hypothetical protein